MEAPKKPSDQEKFTKLLEEMDWVDNESLSAEDQMFTTSLQRVKNKMMKNPFVPIGCLATITVLGLGLRNFMKGGPKQKSQYFMRWRVGLQAATIGALALGIGYEQYSSSKK